MSINISYIYVLEKIKMERDEKLTNIKKMVDDLSNYDLSSIYSLVWSLTSKDLIIKSMEMRQKEN